MHRLSVLFPSFCDGRREPDPQFDRERAALESLGVAWSVVNIEALIAGDVARAMKYFGDDSARLLIYRGWLLHPAEYATLCSAVEQRGATLLTSPQAYSNALLFPRFFPAIADHSFPAEWILGTDPSAALAAARRLGPPPYFIKDHAKSAKEIWPRGCVVASEDDMPRVICELLAFRGDRFESGLVVRPLIRLRCLGESPFGSTLYEEFRLFFFQRQLISVSAYDRLAGDVASLPDYRFLGERIDSPFFSADVVVAEDGRRFLLECGDGGSSALPPLMQPLDFYRSLLSAFDTAAPR